MTKENVEKLGEITGEVIGRDDNSITFRNDDVTGRLFDNTHELDFPDHVDVKLGEEYRILIVPAKGGG